MSRFDAIARDYAEQIPEHMRWHYLNKKVSRMVRMLPAEPGLIGADFGCGIGWYASAMADAIPGCYIIGVDSSREMVAEARRRTWGHCGGFVCGDTRDKVFSDNSFDFAYSINMLHHLPDRQSQSTAIGNMLRALRPGGLLFLHDMNLRFWPFRFYLRHIFWRTRKIDDGNEVFLPAKWQDTFSFLPDFTPKFLLGIGAKAELALERSRWRIYGIHGMTVVRKAEQ